MSDQRITPLLKQGLPIDIYGNAAQLVPASRALARTLDDALTTSTAESITFNAATSLIEMHAYDAAVLFKWLTSTDTAACTTSNFEGVVPKDGFVHRVIPSGVTGISLIADLSQAKYRVIEF